MTRARRNADPRLARRRRDERVPAVPTVSPDAAPAEPVRAEPAVAEDAAAEEAIRRMVEAAYT